MNKSDIAVGNYLVLTDSDGGFAVGAVVKVEDVNPEEFHEDVVLVSDEVKKGYVWSRNLFPQQIGPKATECNSVLVRDEDLITVNQDF